MRLKLLIIIFISSLYGQSVIDKNSKESKFLNISVENPDLQLEIDNLKDDYELDLKDLKAKHKQQKKDLRKSYKARLKELRKKFKSKKKSKQNN